MAVGAAMDSLLCSDPVVTMRSHKEDEAGYGLDCGKVGSGPRHGGLHEQHCVDSSSPRRHFFFRE